MQKRRATYACALILLTPLALTQVLHSAASKLTIVPRAKLCITEGAIEESPNDALLVAVPKMRAYLNAFTSQLVDAHFTFLGATSREARLGSGELRRQFGFKLRAQDACNLVYAMWRIEPESKLVVSMKSNPGQHTSAECGNRGYRNIKPRHSTPVPVLRSGDPHDLRAEINADEMKVFADNRLVWEGPLGAGAALDGPVGIRSDNARLQIQLRVGPPVEAKQAQSPGCKSGPEESE